MQHGSVIDALGGPMAVSRLLGCHPSRPIRWREEGIPRRRWPEIIEAAKQAKRRGITFSALLAGEPKRGASA